MLWKTVTPLKKITNALIKPSYRFVKDLDVHVYNPKDELYYILKIYVDPKMLGRYIEINPNLIDATGKLKKDLTDRPFNEFTRIAKDDDRNQNVAKKLQQDIKKDFYLARKMSGQGNPAGPVILDIVFD